MPNKCTEKAAVIKLSREGSAGSLDECGATPGPTDVTLYRSSQIISCE